MSATNSTYLYDGDRDKVQTSGGASGTTIFWRDPAGHVISETDQSGNVNNNYIYFNGQTVSWIDIGHGVPTKYQYYIHDHLGTTRMITTSTGAVCYDADFFPWGGEQHVFTNSCSQNYKFTAKERDPDTGSDYFGARWFRSTISRFYSPDSDDSAEALAYSDLDDPQTMNLYSYVRNNPLSFIDPDGHMKCTSNSDDPSTIVCEPDPPKKDNPRKEEPPSDPCGFLCQPVFHTLQAQRTWDLAARVTNNYVATPLLTFLSVAVPGVLEAAGPTMETSLGSAIVSGATKGAARQAVEDATMTAAQKTAVKRAIARATSKETLSVERLADGSIRVLKSRPGFDGRQVISTIVKESGQSSTVQIGVGATGEVTHYDPK